MSPSIWDWAAEAYARPGVEAACFALQDRHGQCVPYLLWALWAAPEPAVLTAGAEVARAWSAAVIEPVRSARRASKQRFAGVEDTAREALRRALKASELATERVLLDALAGVAGPAGENRDPFETLRAAAAAWGGEVARDGAKVSDLEQLARAFSRA